ICRRASRQDGGGSTSRKNRSISLNLAANLRPISLTSFPRRELGMARSSSQGTEYTTSAALISTPVAERPGPAARGVGVTESVPGGRGRNRFRPSRRDAEAPDDPPPLLALHPPDLA